MNLSNKTALVFDNGLFCEFAIRLARNGFGRVLYHTPWNYGYPHVADAMVGNGFDEIEWCEDPYDPSIFNTVDCFCFPDVGNAGSQLMFESLGKPVWGSRRADRLELNRDYFKNAQNRLGMPVPRYETITGLTNLRSFLSEHPDVYVKISKFRGSMETFHHVDMDLSDDWLDQKSCEFGGAKESVPFMVEFPISDAIELAGDTYCIDGKVPSRVLNGREGKNRWYIGVMQDYDSLPNPIKEVNDFLSPTLAKLRMRNWWTCEVRILEDSSWFAIDPTTRFASPSGEAQLEIYENLPEIVWAGANGEMIDPEESSKVAVQCRIDHTGKPGHWRTLRIPENIRRWVKLQYPCKISDGLYRIVPQPQPTDEQIGYLLGLGNTVTEAFDNLKQYASHLDAQNLVVHTDYLVDALRAFQEDEDEGLMAEEILPTIENTLAGTPVV